MFLAVSIVSIKSQRDETLDDDRRRRAAKPKRTEDYTLWELAKAVTNALLR